MAVIKTSVFLKKRFIALFTLMALFNLSSQTEQFVNLWIHLNIHLGKSQKKVLVKGDKTVFFPLVSFSGSLIFFELCAGFFYVFR